MTSITRFNFKVLIYDPDTYARHAIYTFLAWDRRTRVTFRAKSLDDMWHHLRTTPVAEQPDYIVMDANHIGGANELRATLDRLRAELPKCRIVCMVQQVDAELVQAAAERGAKAVLLKQEVNLRLGWAIVYAEKKDFTITPAVIEAVRASRNVHPRLQKAAVLPPSLKFPQLTTRVQEALELWLGGMPAYLVADELGIGLSTVRGYIKKAYRILESSVDLEFPDEITQQERAFLRYTALDERE
ncbi:MAG: response regulator transcription factor [Anaerolineae bacterium]|nr:response regulator transcription factor [Chloroflexota bacterium]MBP6298638.1 response regulator transcription factor [Anaerolineae bacterium]